MCWGRIRFISILFLIYMALCFAQRLVYTIWIFTTTHALPSGLIEAYLKGSLFDIATAGLLFLPLLLWFAAFPQNWSNRRAGRAFIFSYTILSSMVALLSIAFEFYFWEDFQARFNFIAVDYLVYTHEVIRNAWESYPVVWFFSGFGLLMAAIAWKLRSNVHRALWQISPARERAAMASLLLAVCTLNFFLHEDSFLKNDAFWGRELGKNSLFALFAAYNRNSIDYKQFYISLDSKEARSRASHWLKAQGSAGEDFPREIRGAEKEQRYNVVLVAIESMSARFLGHYGNKQKLTPNLDRLADEGIWMSRLYATGSRTVRGLEAILLSLPPTPGQSILRRPNSGDLFNLGSVFADRGYQRQFLYGGYATFDNMGPWFASNGFEVVDRSVWPAHSIHFSTAWGACDEDLFDESLRQADLSFQQSKPFFQVLLTTSNHRPYDFPNGRIDIPSHTGRDGAVKYTDFAIGRFVENARKHPWYKNTLFVFVADHNASVAGGTDIPIRDYLIPAIIHNPEIVKPKVISHLASQIDLAPTLLGMLGFSYRSWFFGQDLATTDPKRALLGTYQKVAQLEDGKIVILEPGKRAEIQHLKENGEVKSSEKYEESDGSPMPEAIARTVAIYQTANEIFFEGLSKLKLSHNDSLPSAQ